MFYLICYDIVDDRRRAQVSHLLEGFGIRVQKSVFEAALDRDRYEKLQKKLSNLLDAKQDQLRFYPLPANRRYRVKILGIQPEFAIDDSVFIV